MKFQRLVLENFASYYGKNQPIQLGVTPAKPLIVFVGGTGFGKTSLFDAINWALYGADYEADLFEYKERNIEDYVNEIALKEAYNTKTRLEMSVTLYFEHAQHDNGGGAREYYITQVLEIQPVADQDGNPKASIYNRSHSLFEIKPTGDHVPIPYDKTFLDEILPNNVKSYFLFDGDRIHNLAKPGNSQEVQDAIYRVVDLEIIRNAADHLRDAAIEFGRRAARSATGALAEAEVKCNQELTNQNTLKTRIAEIKKERQAIRDQIDQIDEKLKDLPESRAFQERLNQIKKDIHQNDLDQKELKIRLRDTAAKASLGIAGDSIAELKVLLQEKRAKGEIPKHIRETFFNDLFALKECICGTKFKPESGDPYYDVLKARLEQEKNRSNEEDQLIDLYHQLSQAEGIINEAKIAVGQLEDGIMELENEQRSLILQKQEVDNQLDTMPVEDISKLVGERKLREDADRELYANLNNKTLQLTASEKKFKELDDNRRELGKKHAEAAALHLRAELAKKAADELYLRYETFAEKSRQDVETLTIEEFQKFVISSSGYKVALSDSYSLEVLDSNGNRALQRLSMGQSQCLSLAFITAISRVSRKHPPLVIDMPFSRLDPKVHEAISLRLPNIAQQTILFLIPGVEWNETTRKNLSKHASHMYEMSFDEALRQTTLTSIT